MTMCGTSFPEYIFIRVAIGTLQLIAPLSVLYVALALFLPAPSRLDPGWALSHSCLLVYAILEATFFTCIYLPRRYHLQKVANHPVMSREERLALFRRCSECLASNQDYPSGWFFRSPNFHRKNVLEWLSWAFFSAPLEASYQDEREDEMTEYLKSVEKAFGNTIPDGYNQNTPCMRPTFDPVYMTHRPLLWYSIVGVVDLLTSLWLCSRGFCHYTDKGLFHSFPPRPLTLFSRSSNIQGLSYWYRPHRSVKESPVLFLHGIGIGLYPYVGFLTDLAIQYPDMGIVVPEFLSISSRISAPPLSRSDTIAAICNILDTLNLGNVVIAAHSYGTVVTAQLLRSPLAPRITASLLVDPIPFLLYLPDVAYNFVYRRPRGANEWLLWYFASQDPDVSRTLSRHFFWTENVLWKDDLVDKVVAVALSGRDQVVNSEAVRKYLTGEDQQRAYWLGSARAGAGRLEVLCYPDLDHSMIFGMRKRWRRLIHVLDGFVRGLN